MKKLLIIFAAFLCAGALFCLIFYIHKVKGRSDRLGIAACGANMVDLKDALCKYEVENGALPASLSDLVPGYISENIMYCPLGWPHEEKWGPIKEKWRYTYMSRERTIADREGHHIHGLWTTQADPVQVPIPVMDKRDLKKPAEQITPGKDDIVFEAEHYTQMNYGWEVKESPLASEGRFFTCKEGVANNTAQERGFGDYYNIGGNSDLSNLYYDFHIEHPGPYRVYCRMMTTDTHCSNNVVLLFDEQQRSGLGRSDAYPFIWRWLPANEGQSITLSKGNHRIRVYIWEDGVKLDQFLITRERVPEKEIFRPNYMPGKDLDSALVKRIPKVHVTHDISTLIIQDGTYPRLNIWLRNIGSTKGTGEIETVVHTQEGPVILLKRTFGMKHLKTLERVPVDFSPLSRITLEKREYICRTIFRINGNIIHEAVSVLCSPFGWKVLGPLPFIPVNRALEVEKGQDLKESYIIDKKEYTWKQFENKWYDHFAVMDFGLMAGGNSLHAKPSSAVYAYTEISVPKEGTYLFKVMGDDQLCLWLDTQTEKGWKRSIAAWISAVSPVNRSALKKRVHLSKGRHRLLFRLNQYRGRWQGSVKIRTSDDKVSEITGITQTRSSERGTRKKNEPRRHKDTK